VGDSSTRCSGHAGVKGEARGRCLDPGDGGIPERARPRLHDAVHANAARWRSSFGQAGRDFRTPDVSHKTRGSLRSRHPHREAKRALRRAGKTSACTRAGDGRTRAGNRNFRSSSCIRRPAADEQYLHRIRGAAGVNFNERGDDSDLGAQKAGMDFAVNGSCRKVPSQNATRRHRDVEEFRVPTDPKISRRWRIHRVVTRKAASSQATDRSTS